MTVSPFAESRLPVGSSANRIFGRVTAARASATRCDLAAGKLTGIVPRPVGESHPFQKLLRPGERVPIAENFGGHLHVFEGGQGRDQLETLKDETHLAAPEFRQGIFVQPGDLDSVDGDAAPARLIQPGQKSEQGRFAATGMAGNGHELQFFDIQMNVGENGQAGVAS